MSEAASPIRYRIDAITEIEQILVPLQKITFKGNMAFL
jgi:hypothetical protein